MNHQRQQMTQSQVQDVSIAKMLFCIVIIFLLCNIVTIVSHMLHAFEFHRPNELASISNFLVLVNSAANFVIYSLLSKKFRRVLLHFVRSKFSSCWGQSGTNNNGRISTMTTNTEMSHVNSSKLEHHKSRLRSVS